MAHYLETFGDVYLPACGNELPLSIGAVELDPIKLLHGGAMNPLGADGRAVRRGAALAYRATIAGASPQEFLHELDEVMALMGTQDVLTRLMPDGSRRWVNAVMLDTSGSVTPLDTQHAAVTLSFLILSPYWYASTETVDESTDHYDDDDDLMCLWASGYTLGDAVPMQALVNGGNAPQRDVVFTVTATTGTVTSVTIVNTTTNYTLIWAGSLAAGTELVIDCGALSITADGVDAYDNFTEPTNHDDWMALAPGENNWLLRLTGADATVAVTFYPAWV